MHCAWLSTPNRQGLIISCGLHLLVIGILYHIKPGFSLWSATSYTISLEQGDSASTDLMDEEGHTIREATTIPQQTFPQKTAIPQTPNKVKLTQTKKVPPKPTTPIDRRGLYNTTQTQAKQTNATLTLTGWEWDTAPKPRDPTEECGKIVFQIKVDENGEVIAIHTIEKTVSPMVEKLYADALRELTFSKTSATYTYAPISTGRVTFILVAK